MITRMGRRAFLGGAAVALALPALESLLPRGTAQAGGMTIPRRMLVYFVPNGMPMTSWTPAATGADFPLSTILAPLAELRSDVQVLTGLANRPAERVYRGSDDGGGDHARGTGSFLTCTRLRKTSGTNLRNGISADQMVAQSLANVTRFPSLQFGVRGSAVVGDCDAGYSCAYTTNITWSSATRPLSRLTTPQAAFNRLFGGFDLDGTREEQERRLAYRTSVLDYVHRDATRLTSRLGQTDRQKLDEYLTSVREVEQRVMGAIPLSASCVIPEAPQGTPDYPQHVRLMADLMTVAFRCDLTRVSTFMLDGAGGNAHYPFLGIPGGHHDISHHQNDPEKIRQLVTIGTWEVEQFAYLLRQLKAVREVDGSSLLDHSTVLFSSEISDSNLHTHDNIPTLLAGGCGGQFTTNRHVAYASERPVANLYTAMMRAMGLTIDRFGDDGTGVLENLGPISG